MNHALWALLVVALGIGFLWEMYPLKSATSRIEKLPLSGINFQAESLPLNEQDLEFMKGANAYKYLLVFNQQSFFITIMDGTKNRHAIHDPTYCFVGAGWKVANEERIHFENGYGTLLTMERGANSNEALYFFSDGLRQYSSVIRYWWDTMIRRLTLGKISEEPILIIVQPIQIDTAVNWERLSRQFIPFLVL